MKKLPDTAFAEPFRRRLEKILKRKRLNQAQAALLCGFSPSHLSYIVNGAWCPGLRKLVEIAYGLNVGIEELVPVEEIMLLIEEEKSGKRAKARAR